jgi:hypothetical protein
MAYWTSVQVKTVSLPLNYFLILKSYLHSRHFLLKAEPENRELALVNAGAPQGSVLGPLLYLLYTADLPTSPESTTATFAGDAAVVATDSDPVIVLQKLQTNLLGIQTGLKMWRMKANEFKSIHVTFTARREICPPVHIKKCNLPKKKISSILGYTLTGNLPGTNTLSQNGNN